MDILEKTDWDLWSSYAGLLSLAVFSIYAGAHSSVAHRPKGDEKAVDEEDEGNQERISAKDAWLFPILGSVALVGLYTLVRYLGEAWVNWLLGWYFAIAGVGSVWNSSISLTRYLLGETLWKKIDKVNVSVTKGDDMVIALTLRTVSIGLLPLACIPSGFYMYMGRFVLLNNLLGMSFTHNALALLKLDSFKTGTILLSGLFVYDIWWVFGTEVMVKVATTLDVPIKLLWPKSVAFSGSRGYTMLGVGDIVIPGMFIGLALRYDLDREGGKSKAYFYGTLVGYVLGLIVTMGVMHVFGQAQPALLYLSPGCIGSFVITGLVRGELVQAWGWKEKLKQL